MTTRTVLGPAAAPVAVVAAVVVAAVIGAVLPLDALRELMREDGLVESATVVLYALGVVVALAYPGDTLRPLDRVCLAYLLLGCIGREISVRKHLLNADFGGACCNEAQAKWVIAALLALLVAAVGRLGLRWLRAMLDRSGRAGTYAVNVTLATTVVAAALSQLLDRLPKLLATAAAISPRVAGVLLAFEETLEMMVAFLVVLAVVQALRNRAHSLRAAQPAS